MRKLNVVALGLFSVTVFALSATSQPRRRAPRGPAAPAAPAELPPSPRIERELGQIRWGMSHDQVLDYFRQSIRASYVPRMKNLGQIEQFRLTEARDAEIRAIEQSYVAFDGAAAHRRWDTSFVGGEYTHNNSESMLVYEDARGNREFFFFIADRLWKRVQARNTGGARIDFPAFATQLEGIFGPGRHVEVEGTLRTVEWHDEHTKLHVVDNTTFYNAFCLVYEDLATLGQLATLRRNATPNRTARTTASLDPTEAQVGNTTGDPSPDIVDRITGKMRRVQNADAGAAAARPGTTRPGTSTNPTTPARPTPTAPDNDPLGGLGF